MNEDEPNEPQEGEGSKKRDPKSIVEKIRAQAAAKGDDPDKPAGEDKSQQAAGKEPAERTKGKLSPLDRIRAQAKSSGEKPAAEAKKPASKIEAARAAAATKKEEPKGKAAGAAKVKLTSSAKPVRPKTAPAEPSTRRGFLTWIGVAWASFTAALSLMGIYTVRFLVPNVLREPPSVFKIGPPDQFAEGEVSIQWKNKFGVWIARNAGQLYALRSVCTHLGCTPNWLESEQKFKCPCHGSGFRKDGINFEGPAPRPLERYVITIADDGQVQIDKSVILHEELGQWTEENGAFIALS